MVNTTQTHVHQQAVFKYTSQANQVSRDEVASIQISSQPSIVSGSHHGYTETVAVSDGLQIYG
jgi:hypothetical protein